MPLASAVRTQQADLCAVRWFAVLFGVAAVFLGPLGVVHAQQPANYAERALFDAANHERIAQGLRPLRWDDALANAARDHALRMAQRNALSHQFPGELAMPDRARMAGARYTTIAENVAEGPSPDMIHSSWMHSPPHRANLLAPELNAVGIAVVSTAPRTASNGGVAAGALFAVEDFSQSIANLNYQEQERQVGAALEARGLQISGSADDARKTCTMDRGWAGSGRPGLVVRYESADLTRLPVDLEQRIQGGRYRGASVGACDASSDGGFTRFRVAVLLF